MTLKQFGSEKVVNITWYLENNNIHADVVRTTRNWPCHILTCQTLTKMDIVRTVDLFDHSTRGLKPRASQIVVEVNIFNHTDITMVT